MTPAIRELLDALHPYIAHRMGCAVGVCTCGCHDLLARIHAALAAPAPTAQEIRDAALEEAARVVATFQFATADDVARAIRALKGTR